MEGNFEWFIDHYDEIYNLCGECYVVIKDKKIIKIFDNDPEGYHWVCDNGLLGKVNLQYCNGDESGYTTYCFNDYSMMCDS